MEMYLKQIIDKTTPVLMSHWRRNDLHRKVIEMAIKFLRIGFNKGELKETVEHEVAKAIDKALVYYVNILGEEV